MSDTYTIAMGEVAIVGRDVKYMYVNKACAACHGSTPDNIRGKFMSTIPLVLTPS